MAFYVCQNWTGFDSDGRLDQLLQARRPRSVEGQLAMGPRSEVRSENADYGCQCCATNTNESLETKEQATKKLHS